ncbi:MAG: LamG domain-containing protein [Proteobacteria bacterium]|nr:LamG domain-containing protein [Pseudomonadota bacterium]
MARYPGNIRKFPSTLPNQNSSSGVWSVGDQYNYQKNELWSPARDPYFNYTSLLIQNKIPYTSGKGGMKLPLTFNSDASPNNFLLDISGDVKASPFSPYKNNYSVYLNGTNSYFTVPYTTTNFSTNDFNMECWAYFLSLTSEPTLLDTRSGGTANAFVWGVSSTGQLYYYIGASRLNSTALVTTNRWFHLAISRSSGVVRMFVNGVLGYKATDTANFTGPSTSTVKIGDLAQTGAYWPGYISNFRVVKGNAIYTAPFNPPTTPLTAVSGTSLLTFQSNRFIDNSGNSVTVTGVNSPAITENSPLVEADTTTGSGYFDGTSDYLSVANNTRLQLSNSIAWCVEFWFYATALSSEKALYNGFDPSGSPNYNGFGFNLGSNGQSASTLMVYDGTNWTNIATVTVNQWYHVAVSYEGSGTTRRCFLNGVQQGSAATVPATVTNTATATAIGALSNGNFSFPGYISDVRVVKGSVVYTNNFTPPTAPLTAIQNTSLLTCQTRAPASNSGFIDSGPNNFLVTRSGNATQGSFSPFSPTGWSYNFIASSTQYITMSSSNFALGTGAFTIEGWIYLRSHTYGAIFSTWNTNTGQGVILAHSPGGTITFNIGHASGASTDVTASVSLSLHTWTFLQATKTAGSGGTMTIYVNGTAVGSNTTTRSLDQTAGSIGRYYNNDTTHRTDGHIFNVRVSNIVRSNTVPTGNFVSDTNTLLLSAQSNRFIDLSPNNLTLTPVNVPTIQPFNPYPPTAAYSPILHGGSGYFPTSSSLTIPTNTALNFGAGDFCIEAWVYPVTSSCYIAVKYVGGNVSSSEYYYLIDGTNQLSIALDGGGGEDYFRTSSNTITLYSWNHCVVTRVGTAVRLFINGVLLSYNTTSRTLNTTSTNLVTGSSAGSFVSSLRIIKGTIPNEYQTSSTTSGTKVFNPPTTPLTAIPNTSLLLNFSNAAIIDATGRNNIETILNTQINKAQSKYNYTTTGVTNYFDGTGDYNTIADSVLLELGSGNFTIEAWIYPITAGGNHNIFGKGTDGNNWWAFYIAFISSAPRLEFAIVSGGSVVVDRISNDVISLNTWTHVAVCRSGSTFKLFINGTEASGYTGTPSSTSSAVPDYSINFNNGANRWVGSNNEFYGYMDGLRVTKYARYTSNFTVPAGPLQLA